MLISEKFVLAALHPEAQSAIEKMVAGIAGGTKPPKAIRAGAELAELGKPVVALVCDPRTWYLALWRQGCGHKGPLFKRFTDPAQWLQLRAKLAKRGSASGGGDADEEEGGGAFSVPAAWSAEYALSNWYADANSPEAFREWLVAVLGTRPMRSLVAPAYQRSPVSRSCGLMSYEYLNLFINNPNNLGAPPSNTSGLKALDASRGIVAHTVRVEAVAEDLASALGAMGLPLTAEHQALLAAHPKGAVARRREWQQFYDAETLKLLFQRERFVAQRFGYRQRGAAAAAAAADGAAQPGAPAAKKLSGAAAKAARQEKADAATRAREARQAERKRERQEAAGQTKTARPRLADFDDDD